MKTLYKIESYFHGQPWKNVRPSTLPCAACLWPVKRLNIFTLDPVNPALVVDLEKRPLCMGQHKVVVSTFLP